MAQTYANPDVHVAQGWACGDGQAVLPQPSWDYRVNDAKCPSTIQNHLFHGSWHRQRHLHG